MANKGEVQKFVFGYQDIARATGMSMNTIVVARYRGKLNPNDLKNLARWIMEHRMKKGLW